MKPERFLLTDQTWSRISPLLPGKDGDPGRSGANNRLFVEAVLHVARTGVPWRDLPSGFGAWNTVYKRFSRWGEAGIWERVFAELSKNADFSEVSIDSTSIRAHQHAAGAPKKLETRLLAALVEDLQLRFTR
jgi:transposase